MDSAATSPFIPALPCPAMPALGAGDELLEGHGEPDPRLCPMGSLLCHHWPSWNGDNGRGHLLHETPSGSDWFTGF